MINALITLILEVLAPIGLGVSCYGLGWYACDAKYKRVKHAEAVRLATTNTVRKPVLLEDMWSEYS